MPNQAANCETVSQSESFAATNSPEPAITNFEDKLHLTDPPKKKYGLKIPVTLDPGVFVHEIRNPLTNINLAVYMLKAEIKDKSIEKYVDIINRNSDRINEIVNDLLKSSKKDPAKTDQVSINELLDEVLEIAKDRVILKNISVRKSYMAYSCELSLDKPKITIALLNIIVNAIEAMPSEHGELKVTSSLSASRCVVAIEDNGCGISKKNVKKIFKPYFTSKPGGMGIGLAATYDILVAHQAGVNVESEEGKGTRFMISFNIS